MKYLPDSFPSDNLDSLEARRLEYFYEHFVIKRFDRYGFGHFALACYAALPAILTPDLIHKIWLNFKKYSVHGQNLNIHPVAPADLLLSPLVEEIGFELYEMAEPIRRALLLHLHQLSASPEDQHIQFFPLKDIAAFLLDYARQDRTADHKEDDEFWEAQEWTALSYLDPAAALAKVGNAFADKEAKPEQQLRHRDAIEKMASRFELGIVDYEKAVPGEYKGMRAVAHVMREIILNREAQLLDYFQQKEDWKSLLSDKAEEGEGLISIKIPEVIEGNITILPDQHKKRKVKALVVAVSGITASGWIRVGEEENNAELFKNLLETHISGDVLELQVLLAEKATKAAILEAWEHVIESAGIKDDLLFYLSCNGAKQNGHCYAACFDSLPLTADTYETWLADEEIGLLAQKATCSSITAIIQVDHAATPYWLDVSKPGNVVFASDAYEQEASTYKIEEAGKYYCGFTYALVQTLRKWGMAISNNRLFIETLEAYENPPEDSKKQGQGGFSTKTPQLAGAPGTIERLFLHHDNIYARIQNLLRHAGDEVPVVSGKWDSDTNKALYKISKTASQNFATKQDYIQYLKLETQKRVAQDRPIFLFVFCDPEGTLTSLEKEKSAIKKIFEGRIPQTNIDLRILENPTKEIFQDFFKNSQNRNRIHLFHFSGFGYESGIGLEDGEMNKFYFLKLLGFQRNIRLAFFNACYTGLTTSWASQCGVWNTIGISGNISDNAATQFAIQFYKYWLKESGTIGSAFQDAYNSESDPLPEGVHRGPGRSIKDALGKLNTYVFRSAAWLNTNWHGERFKDYLVYPNVFIHYNNESAKDMTFFKEIEKRLIILRKKHVICTYWHIGLIELGDDIDEVIQQQLNQSQLVLLLVSSDYFGSDSSRKLHDLIMKLKEQEDFLIVPILLRPVEISGTDLEKYISLPKSSSGEMFLSKWSDPEEAYLHIELELRRLATEFRERSNKKIDSIPITPKSTKDNENPSLHPEITKKKEPEVLTTGTGSKTIYALLAGINDYQSPVPKLNGCVPDVKSVEAYLRGLSDTPVEVKILTDQTATKNNIVAGFRNHLSKATTGDTVLFYYAGHGTQEEADEVFWRSEPSHRLQALVCYDGVVEQNGQQQFNLLADKEMRYLLHELSATGAHIVTVFDCCYSGYNTRSQQPQVAARRYAPQNRQTFAVPQRRWEQFIFSDKLPREAFDKQSIAELLPEGRHVQIAACAPDEGAFEQDGRGVFTRTLLDVLQRSGNNVSYYNLESRVRSLLKNNYRQTPRIYASSGHTDELFHNFLDRKGTEDAAFYGNVIFRSGQGWYLELGSNAAVTVILNEITVLSQDGQQKFNARIGKVMDGRIELFFDGDIPDENGFYKAPLSGLFSVPLAVYFDVKTTETAGLQFMEQAWKEAGRDLARVEVEKDADYTLIISDDRCIITNPGDPYLRPVTPVLQRLDISQAKLMVDWLQHIAHWEFVKNLHNEYHEGGVRLLKPNSIEMEVFKIDDKGEHLLSLEGDDIRLAYEQQANGNLGGRIKIRLTNRFSRDLHVALLYLSMNFGSDGALLKPIVYNLKPGESIWTFEGKVIPLTYEDQVKEFNLPESLTRLKLIANTEFFDVAPLLLNDLPPPTQTHRVERSRSTGLKASSDTRDWTTRLITLRMPNPYYTDEKA